MLMSIDRVTRKDPNVYLDAQAMAEALFGDHMAVNPIMLGAAYQAGALPVSAASIEKAIRLNGVSVEMNLLAFRWGRMAVVDRKQVEAAVAQATTRAVEQRADPERGGARPGGPGGRLRRAAAPARDPGARADRLPERGLRGRVRGLRGARRAGGGGAGARPAGARGGGRALPLQADGLQGRVRGGAAAPRRGGPGRSCRPSSDRRSAPTGTCTRRSCARSASRRRSGSAPGSRPAFALLAAMKGLRGTRLDVVRLRRDPPGGAGPDRRVPAAPGDGAGPAQPGHPRPGA